MRADFPQYFVSDYGDFAILAWPISMAKKSLEIINPNN
jgi:hypothetical protein